MTAVYLPPPRMNQSNLITIKPSSYLPGRTVYVSNDVSCTYQRRGQYGNSQIAAVVDLHGRPVGSAVQS